MIFFCKLRLKFLNIREFFRGRMHTDQNDILYYIYLLFMIYFFLTLFVLGSFLVGVPEKHAGDGSPKHSPKQMSAPTR